MFCWYVIECIGVGLDFNTDLVNHITTNITGASYMSVASSAEFKKQIDEDFDYMVCPLVFDVTIKMDTLADNKVMIDQIYGTPEADNKTGVCIHVGTLFPSARNATGETKVRIIHLYYNS
jgi:Ca-activated chloride channel family protein